MKSTKKTRKEVVFYLNGARVEVSGEKAHLMLSDYLRYEKNLTGTKVVCAEGDCGACTVLRRFHQKTFIPMNSCIATIAQMDGSSLITVDALAKEPHAHNSEYSNLSPVQKAMVTCHGSQCGFCTPGFVMALTGSIEQKICDSKKTCTALTDQEAKNALTGNLCRCTGYQSIIDAATSIDLSKYESIIKQFDSKEQQADLKKIKSLPLLTEGKTFSLFAPTTLKDAVNFLAKNKNARLISAGTDLGVVSNKGKLRLEKLLSLHLIPELYEIKKSKSAQVSVGARVSLSELRIFTKTLVPEFSNFLDLFASPQIKNVATLIGNVGNASPIADTPPFLLVSHAVIHVLGAKGKRKIPIDQFYLDYRKTALKPGEFITSIDFEIPQKNEKIALYKTSQRKDLDISIVNAAFRMKQEKNKIKSITLAMGGVAATPLRLKKTEKLLQGNILTPELLAKGVQCVHSEMNPLSDLRGSSAYRRVLVENLFLKFFRENA